MNETVLTLRKSGLKSYIAVFCDEVLKAEGLAIEIDAEQAAERICDLYFRYAEEVIRPVVTSGIIQHYKIIGHTELAVLRVQPIAVKNGDVMTAVRLNAMLAMHIGISFLIEWNEIEPQKFRQIIGTDGPMLTFIREHLIWLMNVDVVSHFPGFSNSQIWRLFHYLISDRIHRT